METTPTTTPAPLSDNRFTLIEADSRPQLIMTISLMDKLALMVWYLEEVRCQRRSSDTKGFDSLLDDAEVQNWLTAMDRAGRIVNTRFTLRK